MGFIPDNRTGFSLECFTPEWINVSTHLIYKLCYYSQTKEIKILSKDKWQEINVL